MATLHINEQSQIPNEIINRHNCLSSIYFSNTMQNNRNNINISNEKYTKISKSNLFDNNFHSKIVSNINNNENMTKDQCSQEIHRIIVKIPSSIDIQLKYNRLLANAIRNYRRHKRFLTLSKYEKIIVKNTTEKNVKNLSIVNVKPLCPIESNVTLNIRSTNLSIAKTNLTTVMKRIHRQYHNKIRQVCLAFKKLRGDIFSIVISNRRRINI